MNGLSFNVGAVQQFIKESANSFDAKVGGGVVADNKKNNEKKRPQKNSKLKDKKC